MQSKQAIKSHRVWTNILFACEHCPNLQQTISLSVLLAPCCTYSKYFRKASLALNQLLLSAEMVGRRLIWKGEESGI